MSGTDNQTGIQAGISDQKGHTDTNFVYPNTKHTDTNYTQTQRYTDKNNEDTQIKIGSLSDTAKRGINGNMLA